MNGCNVRLFGKQSHRIYWHYMLRELKIITKTIFQIFFVFYVKRIKFCIELTIFGYVLTRFKQRRDILKSLF